MDAATAAIIAGAAGILVPLLIVMVQNGQSGRSAFVTEARLLLDAQTARAEQAEHERNQLRDGSPMLRAELKHLTARLDDHIASEEYTHTKMGLDMSELGREVDTLRRNMRDLWNKRGPEATA